MSEDILGFDRELSHAVLSVDMNVAALNKILGQTKWPINKPLKSGYCLVHLAAMADWHEDEDGRLTYLLKQGANPRMAVGVGNLYEGNNALHIASYEGHFSQFCVLLKAFPGLALECNREGKSPLMLILEGRCFAWQKLTALLPYQADFSEVDSYGMRVCDYLKRYLESSSPVNNIDDVIFAFRNNPRRWLEDYIDFHKRSSYQ